MSAWSIVLRLMLALTLVLNGAASAIAGVRMAAVHEHEAPVAASADADSTPCRDHLGVGTTADHGAHEHPAADTGRAATGSVDPDGDPGPDCCKAGACQCACTHCTQVLAPSVAGMKPMFEYLGDVGIPATGHPAPTLPHLIRPPIG